MYFGSNLVSNAEKQSLERDVFNLDAMTQDVFCPCLVRPENHSLMLALLTLRCRFVDP